MVLLEQQGDGAAIIVDRFVQLDDEEGLPTSGGLLVSLTRFRTDKAALVARGEDFGVWLKSDETADMIAEDLDSLAVVALEFPVFSDGRAFSTARILRERYGYTGELRAVGDVLCEQLSFMLRSGFDTFAMASEKAVEEFKAVMSEVSVVYQPTGDGRATAMDARLGRR
jgi:uncharacterized protein (DUF934 family)